MQLHAPGTPDPATAQPADPWSVPATAGPGPLAAQSAAPAWPAAGSGTPFEVTQPAAPAYSAFDSWSGPPVHQRMHPGLAATLGVVGGGIVVAALSAFAFFGMTAGDEYLAETYGPGGDHPRFALSQGTCATGPLEDVTTGTAAACSGGGVNEAYLRARVPLGAAVAYDRLALDDHADTLCYMDFRTATSESYEDSPLEYVALVPSRSAWRAGSRDVVCVLLPE